MSLNDLFIFFNAKFLPLIFSIIGFGLLIVVHEMGHFLFCKAFGIHTPTFSIGFGPKLIEKKIGDTNLRIAQIPLGGYVEIAGLAEVGQGDQEHAKAEGYSSFSGKPFWQKFLVLMGGIIFNIMFAYAAFSAMFMIGETGKRQAISIAHVVKDSPAAQAGLKEQDIITQINGKVLTPTAEKPLTEKLNFFFKYLEENPTERVKVIVERDNEEMEFYVTPKAQEINGKQVGIIGVVPSIPMPRYSIIQSIKMGFTKTNEWIKRIALSLKNLFSKRSLEGAGGPVMILAQGFKFAQGGIVRLLLFLAIMSINLALFNLLPLGITDGGQLVFAMIESIIGRPTPDSIRMIVNVISLALFIFLAVYLTYKDVVSLFGTTFKNIYEKVLLLLGR